MTADTVFYFWVWLQRCMRCHAEWPDTVCSSLLHTRNFSTVQRGKGTLHYATSWECLHCVFITVASININSGVGQTLQKWLISSFLCFQDHFALVCRPMCSVKSYIMQNFAINIRLHSCPVQVFEHQSSFLSISTKAKQCNRSPTLKGFYLSRARRTPSLSTRSELSLRPAVSLRRTGNPPRSRAVSTTSLVVPAMGDTMAAGLWPGIQNVNK